MRDVVEADAQEIDLEAEPPALPPLQPGFGELLYRSWMEQQGRYDDDTFPALPPAPAYQGPVRAEPPTAAMAQLGGYTYALEPPLPRPAGIERFANWLARVFGTAPR